MAVDPKHLAAGPLLSPVVRFAVQGHTGRVKFVQRRGLIRTRMPQPPAWSPTSVQRPFTPAIDHFE